MDLEDFAFEVELGCYVYSFEEVPAEFMELFEVVDLSGLPEPEYALEP